MYMIDKTSNSIKPLEKRSFSSLEFREREHLQEWIAKQPNALGEDLLIIQKEFSGFGDTQERLDLLALDKQGALVVIENKLDDSGRDVTWQALKYASYCSGLSKANIANIYQKYLDAAGPGGSAEERISEFMGDDLDFEEIALNKGVSQRIIFIAAKFRKEVTSAVLWLLNFKIRLQCFRATPYAMDEELFLKVEQIIPTPDAEDYMIGLAEKAQDDIETQAGKNYRQSVRRKFWSRLIPEMNNTQSSLFQKINPGVVHFISATSGVRGIGFNMSVSKKYGRASLYIDYGEKEENKSIFDQLQNQKEKIETAFGGPLDWQRLDDKRASRIKAEIPGDVFNSDQWDAMIKFMVDAMCRLEKAIKEPLREIGGQLKKGATAE